MMIEQVVNPERTYLISDLHLEHRNIIRYCRRPFKDVAEMNWALVRNWNAIVRPDDAVYYLGDFCFANPLIWLKRLAGRITFIRGSHDYGMPTRLTSHSAMLSVEDVPFYFYLVHKLSDAPPGWHGCVIHGHDHNNQPFVDGKRVNVSVEVIDYKPVSLAKIICRLGSEGKG